MAYPKPLSAKSIEKLLSTWDPHTVEVLHTYYEAFANLYGVIQLRDAWKKYSSSLNPRFIKSRWTEFVEGSPFSYLSNFLNQIDYQFESQEQLQQLLNLVSDFVNNSHLWRNCGYTPKQLYMSSVRRTNQALPAIKLGSGIQKALQDGKIDKEDFIRLLREKGFDVVD